MSWICRKASMPRRQKGRVSFIDNRQKASITTILIITITDTHDSLCTAEREQ